MLRRKIVLLFALIFVTHAAALTATAQDDERQPDSLKNAAPAPRSNPDALYRRGSEQFRAGRYAEAAELFRQVARLRPDVAEVQFYMGSAFYKQRKYREAAEAYREAVRLKPDYVAAHVYLGNSLDYGGAYEEAVAVYRQAARVAPSAPEPYFEMGVAHYNRRLYREAAESFRQAARLRPTHADTLYRLGLAHIAGGDAEVARLVEQQLRTLSSTLADQLLARIGTQQ